MSLIRGLCLICAIILMVFFSDCAYADYYIPRESFQYKPSTVFACASNQNAQEYWFSILFKRRYAIPLIYPQELTIVFHYSKETGVLSEAFRIYQRITSIVPYDEGIVFTRDHYFFADQELCFFSNRSKRISVLREPKTVGYIIAMYDHTMYYRGHSCYDDNKIYSYDFQTHDVEMLVEDADIAFADENKLYIVNEKPMPRIDVYDRKMTFLYSNHVNSSKRILSISDEKVLMEDGKLLFLASDDACVSPTNIELNKTIDAGWITADYLFIVSDGRLESYKLEPPAIQQIFSQALNDDVCNIDMHFDELFLFDKNELSIRVVSMDGEEQYNIPLFP